MTCRALTTWAAPRILAGATFASGALLLFSGARPGAPERLAWLGRVIPLPLLEASHFAASLAGLVLLLVAQAIARRIDAAFYVSAVALAAGAIASLTKGGDFEAAAMLAVVFVALMASRRHFTRHARVFEQPLSRPWIMGVGTVVASSIWLGFFAYRDVAYTHDLWWQFAVEANAPRFLRASVVVAVVALVIAVRHLLRPVLPVRERLDEHTAADVERVVAQQPRAMANLVFVGDKSLLWNDAREAFIMYAVHGRSCVALGDPVGPADAARELVDRFLQMCHHSALTPVFYETTGERLADYADYGLAAVKIGEEAMVPLAGFSLQGARYKAAHGAQSRAA